MMTTYPGTVDRIVIVTDAWMPQINGVVRTLRTTAEVLRSRGLHVEMITPQVKQKEYVHREEDAT